MTLARLELLLAAVLFSTGGAVMKAITLSAWQVASFRAIIAAATLLLLVPASRKVSGRALVVGLAQAGTFVTFVVSNKLTTAASAVFLQASAPFWLIILGPLLLGERSSRRDVPFLGVILLGLVLLMLGTPAPTVTAPNTSLGNVVGAVSGVLWALTLAGLRWAGRHGAEGGRFTAQSATMCGNLIAFLVCLPLAVPVGTVGVTNWALVLYLGIVQVGLAYLFLTRGIGRVPAVEAALLLLLEPALSPFWAWLVHGEKPGVLAALGGALILAATASRSVRGARRSKLVELAVPETPKS